MELKKFQFPLNPNMIVAMPNGARIQEAEVAGGKVKLEAWVPSRTCTEYREFVVLPGALGIGPGRDLRLVTEFPDPAPPHEQRFLFEDKTPHAEWPGGVPPEYASQRRLIGHCPAVPNWEGTLPRRSRR